MTQDLSDAERLTRDFGETVLQAIGHLAPERAAELNELIAKLSLDTIKFEHGRANFAARVRGTEILVTFPALLSLWATARAAVLIGTAGMEAVRDGTQALDTHPGTPMSEAFELLDAARDLIRNPNAIWPKDLAVPSTKAANGTLDYLSTNMFLAAAGWINLHEIAHFYLSHELDTTEALLKKQEYEADDWATSWVLTSCPPDLYEFRIFGIAVAFTWIGLIDEIRRGSSDHPHVWDRFERSTRQFDTGVTGLSPGLELSAHVVKAVFMPYDDFNVSDTPQDAFFSTLLAASRLPR